MPWLLNARYGLDLPTEPAGFGPRLRLYRLAVRQLVGTFGPSRSGPVRVRCRVDGVARGRTAPRPIAARHRGAHAGPSSRLPSRPDGRAWWSIDPSTTRDRRPPTPSSQRPPRASSGPREPNRHTRREAGPQSHGPGTQVAGLPKSHRAAGTLTVPPTASLRSAPRAAQSARREDTVRNIAIADRKDWVFEHPTPSAPTPRSLDAPRQAGDAADPPARAGAHRPDADHRPPRAPTLRDDAARSPPPGAQVVDRDGRRLRPARCDGAVAAPGDDETELATFRTDTVAAGSPCKVHAACVVRRRRPRDRRRRRPTTERRLDVDAELDRQRRRSDAAPTPSRPRIPTPEPTPRSDRDADPDPTPADPTHAAPTSLRQPTPTAAPTPTPAPRPTPTRPRSDADHAATPTPTDADHRADPTPTIDTDRRRRPTPRRRVPPRLRSGEQSASGILGRRRHRPPADVRRRLDRAQGARRQLDRASRISRTRTTTPTRPSSPRPSSMRGRGPRAIARACVAALRSALGTEAGGRTLALGRNLPAYVIAADLISLQDRATRPSTTSVVPAVASRRC